MSRRAVHGLLLWILLAGSLPPGAVDARRPYGDLSPLPALQAVAPAQAIFPAACGGQAAQVGGSALFLPFLAEGAQSTQARSVGRGVADIQVLAQATDPAALRDFAAATAFLYQGSQAPQTGLRQGMLEAERTAVVRGRVTDRAGAPLPNVTVAVVHQPEYGQTSTRADGMFDLAVNGGGLLKLCFVRDGYVPVQRQIDALNNDYTWFEEPIVLMQLDNRVTAVDLRSSAPIQAAQASPVSDADGTRRPTLFSRRVCGRRWCCPMARLRR
ncbi:MAG: carboxypeptidase regulatory-like domain-containing protein [Oscillochloris sp.]|nr:carboxypeptidase regulatory-like domain-containing protein [Oscillochloris sp.]